MVEKEVRINTRSLFIFNLFYFIKYVFSGQVFTTLLVYSIFSIYLDFATYAEVISMILHVVFLSLVYKFAFDILADTARGNMSPFVKKNYLVNNDVFIKVIFIGLMIEMITFVITDKGYGADVKLIFIVVSTIFTPAVFMIIALTDSLLMAFNPLRIFRIISASFISYVLFVAFWAGTQLFHELIIRPYAYEYLPIVVEQIVSNFFKYTLIVMNFHIMGYLIFQNRDELDLHFIGFKAVEEHDVLIKYSIVVPAHETVKKLLKNDEPEQALSIVEELQENGDASPELQGLHEKAKEQKSYSPTNLDISRRVHKHLNLNNRRKAYYIAIDHIKSGEEYHPESPFDISRLIQFAVIIDKTDHIAHLLKDFHLKYPYHEDIVLNYFTLSKVLYKDRKTRKKAKELLVELVTTYPSDKSMPDIKAWLKGLNSISKSNDERLLWP